MCAVPGSAVGPAHGKASSGPAGQNERRGRQRVSVLKMSAYGCRIRGAVFDNTVTAGKLWWEDGMKYMALLYGEPGAGPAPGTPEFMEMLGEFQSATAAMAEAGVLVDSS